jgi:hypothetical protein
MKNYTPEELQTILAKHKAWLNNEEGGERANLSDANLSYANLSYANLRNANLSYANLSDANLSYANLSYANLRNANLSYANLSDANLSYANLSDANLSDANLSDANLSDANLRNANLRFNVFFGGSYGAPVYQACRGFGSRNATLTLLALGEPEEWRFFTGCFCGTRAELEEAVAEKHGGTTEQANYLRAIEYLWQTALSNR